jgi:hypothetical protein
VEETGKKTKKITKVMNVKGGTVRKVGREGGIRKSNEGVNRIKVHYMLVWKWMMKFFTKYNLVYPHPQQTPEEQT